MAVKYYCDKCKKEFDYLKLYPLQRVIRKDNSWSDGEIIGEYCEDCLQKVIKYGKTEE